MMNYSLACNSHGEIGRVPRFIFFSFYLITRTPVFTTSPYFPLITPQAHTLYTGLNSKSLYSMLLVHAAAVFLVRWRQNSNLVKSSSD